ncbi:rhodanese-like domain-containing protein [Spirosoma radiotolerans]|uniref:Sulfurtransferase n=1 Tax=Spirosoma radiotolerans TaxID=1379870 RepID=A0A0E3V7Z4_9BACT|nr:rhodanese-like domain-containing protein [Spirosoma radiotolerans]AKD55866.1 sulfurtransferase [Spirosoma radiotolerans]
MSTHTYTDITLPELEELRNQPHTAIVDVRDEWEFDEFNIGGLNIPLPDIRARKAEILPYQTLIVICTNGVRSRVAAKDLRRQAEFQDQTIYHLHGGIIEAVD